MTLYYVLTPSHTRVYFRSYDLAVKASDAIPGSQVVESPTPPMRPEAVEPLEVDKRREEKG